MQTQTHLTTIGLVTPQKMSFNGNRVVSSVLAIFLCIYMSFGQTAEEPLLLSHPDSLFDLEAYTQQFVDSTRVLDFQDVQQAVFSDFDSGSKNVQARYWYRFNASTEVSVAYFYVYFFGSDLVELYVPETTGYRKYTTGRLAEQQINFHRYETSTIQLKTGNIDFSKPFFYNKVGITTWGRANLKHPASVLLSDQSFYTKDGIIQDYKTPRYTIFLSIFLICFVLLLTNYLISGDTNFRNYGIYLLTIVLMFSCRIPWVYNLFNHIDPDLYFLTTYVGHFLGIAGYLYFIQQFVGFKSKSAHIYNLSRITITAALFLTIFGVVLSIFYPFFPYRFAVVEVFEILFTIATLYMVIRLLLLKTTFVEKVVLFGSIFLIVGNALTVITNSNVYFLATALIETIIFAAAISVANKIVEKNRLQTQFDLAYSLKEKENLMELDRLKSKFFTNISHEFRTPLTLIKGPIEDQLASTTLTTAQRKNIAAAQKNTYRLESLVEEMLALSKLESGALKLQVSSGNLRDFILAQTDAFTYSSTEKQIDFQIELENHSEAEWFDHEAIQKIITNLLGNAFKYTPEQGTITLKGKKTASSYELEIQNSDSYISEANQLQIFQRFYQTDPSNPGTGIGLALTKELVELHKGQISVESTKEYGTLFKLKLPVIKEAFSASEIITNSTPSIERTVLPSEDEVSNKFTSTSEDTPIMLIVDDHKEVRGYIASLFEHSFNIRLASNGDEASIDATETIPDIIISDVVMAQSSGIELTKHLKSTELTSHIPILLLTGKTEDKDRFIGLESGADAYLTKPFNPNILKATVQNLLDTRRKLQDRFSQEVLLTPKEISVSSADEQFLIRLQQVMDEHLTNPNFSATNFSDEMGVSRMQLHRKLKALAGLSTSEFLKSQRLYAAAQLIKQDKISISEVGYTVGFNDPSYFAKCFRLQFGMTPTEYSKKY